MTHAQRLITAVERAGISRSDAVLAVSVALYELADIMTEAGETDADDFRELAEAVQEAE